MGIKIHGHGKSAVAKDSFEHVGGHSGFYGAGGEGVAQDVGSYALEGKTIFVDGSDYPVEFLLHPVAAQRLSFLCAEKIAVRALCGKAPIGLLGKKKGGNFLCEGDIPYRGEGFWGIFKIAAAVDIFEGAADVEDVFFEVDIGKAKGTKFAVAKSRSEHHREEVFEIAVLSTEHKGGLLLTGESRSF